MFLKPQIKYMDWLVHLQWKSIGQASIVSTFQYILSVFKVDSRSSVFISFHW